MEARKPLEHIPDPNKFDLTVDRWNSQGHRVGPRNPYRKYIIAGSEYYERPLNSGNLWLENNRPAGRVICEFNEKGHITKKEFDFGAAHTAYIPAPTGAEKLAGELAAERAKSAQLEAELRAITREREAKQPGTAAPLGEVRNYAPQVAMQPKLTKQAKE